MSQNQNCGTTDCCTPAKTDERILNPHVDIAETGETLILTVDMPGVNEDEVDITLEEHVLTIEAQKQQTQFEGVSPAYVEHQAGRYQRKFKLTDEIERENIEATLKDGVLRVTLRKVKAPLPQKIKVLSA